MPTIHAPEQWRAFYAAAAQFRDLAPWSWMYESNIFGVQHPETGEIGWCSIMGNAGEHFALAIYRGAAGLNYYNMVKTGDFESTNNPELFNAFFSQDCWMVSFEDATMVPPEQKAHLKSLGLSFRGAGQWIVVQALDLGLAPWLADAQDVPYLTQCLQQAIDVTGRAKSNPGLSSDALRLVRTPTKQPGGLVWKDTFSGEPDSPEPTGPQPVEPSKGFLDKTERLPEIRGAVALSSFFVPKAIQENKNKRPWHPMLLIGIEPKSGYILAQELAAYADVPAKLEKLLLSLFKAVGGKPRQIGVHHPPVARWLEKIGTAAGIEIVLLTGDEPFLTDVIDSFSDFLR
ncbi:MAG: hypothetical protein IPM81_04370 [Saprospirales bacterium]|nr:hypothetical protein [Saprospirales bacterium]